MKKIASLFCFLLSFTAFTQNELPSVDLTTIEGKKINFQEAAKSDNVVIVFSLGNLVCAVFKGT